MFPKAICYIAIEDNKEAISLLEEKCKDEDKIEVKALKQNILKVEKEC